jgi:hypothetical protein
MADNTVTYYGALNKLPEDIPKVVTRKERNKETEERRSDFKQQEAEE